MPGSKQAWPKVAACWSPAPRRSGSAPPKQRRVGLAVDLARRAHLGQHRPRHVEELQQLVVPVERVDVEQQRAAGVADVGDVLRAAGQPPDQEGVDVPNRISPRSARARRPSDRVEQVLDLRAGEVRVDDEARSCSRNSASWPSALRRSQIGARDAALPDDGVRHGLPVLRSQSTVVSRWLVTPIAAMSAGSRLRAGERLASPSRAATPDRLGIVLDVARRRERSAGTPAAPTRRRVRHARRRSRGSRSCPDRARECRPWGRIISRVQGTKDEGQKSEVGSRKSEKWGVGSGGLPTSDFPPPTPYSPLPTPHSPVSLRSRSPAEAPRHGTAGRRTRRPAGGRRRPPGWVWITTLPGSG